jgi:hypothetical protein
VLAAAFNPDGAAYLGASSPSDSVLKPQFAHLPPRELLSAPLTVFTGVSDEQSAAVALALGIRTVRDLVLFRRTPLFYAAKRVLRDAVIPPEPDRPAAGTLLTDTDFEILPPTPGEGSDPIIG